MFKLKKYYLLLIYLFLPYISFAAWKPGKPIVPDCARKSSGSICGFSDLITLIDNLLNVFIWISVPIATILFAVIGWTLITQGDKPAAIAEAKSRLMTLVIGVGYILAAWLIVKLIVTGLGGSGDVTKYLKK